MASYSRIYCIGGEGGFMGSDGVNPIDVQILDGDGGRQWLEPLYVQGPGPGLGNLKALVPKGPDHPDALLDACIAFEPHRFGRCSSMADVVRQLGRTEQIDFDTGEGVPATWAKLRDEASPLFAKLHIWEARLEGLKLAT